MTIKQTDFDIYWVDCPKCGTRYNLLDGDCDCESEDTNATS